MDDDAPATKTDFRALDAKIDGVQKRGSHTLPKTIDDHGERLRDHERRIAAIETGRQS